MPYVFLRNNQYTENIFPAIQQALVSGAVVGAAGDGLTSSATRADYAAAASLPVRDMRTLHTS